jgi:putative NIF3 family GTP cyclohydrolase 1 type 2
VGELKDEARLADVCQAVKEKLGIAHSLAAVGDPGRMVRRIGICTGAGGDMMEDALRNGCSLYITGDVRHHEAMFALQSGLCLIDAGHYATERIFAANFAGKLKAAVGDIVEVLESRAGSEPFTYL